MDTLGSDLSALAELLERAGDGIILTDGDARIRWASKGTVQLFGYAPGELVGKDLHVLLPVRFRRSHARWMRAFGAGVADTRSMAQDRVVLGLHRSGREIPLSATISRLDEGRTLGVCLHDATHRAALELALEEKLDRARQLADELPVLITYLDGDLHCRFVNGAYEAWSGRPREALEGRPARSLIHSETWARSEPHLRDALGGRRTRFRTRVLDASGRTREVDVLAVPAERRDGTVNGVYVVAAAASRGERWQGLHAVLREAGKLLGASVEPLLSLPSVLSLAVEEYAERAQAVVELSGDRYRVLGADQANASSQSAVDLHELPEGDSATVASGAPRAFSALKDRWVHLTHPIQAHGRIIGALRLSWAWPYDPGRDDGEILEDLATRIGIAFERAAALTEAREAALQRDWVMERVLHDLSGPTAAIWMAADRLLRSAPDPDRRRRSRIHLQGIAQQAKELERLILDLRSATGLRSGHAIVVAEETGVEAIVSDVVSTLGPLASWHETNLVVRPGDHDVRVVVDPYHLRRLLSALVMNAVRHGAPGGSVELAYAARAGRLVFEVLGSEEACPDEAAGVVGMRLDLRIAREIAEGQGTSVSLTRGADRCVASFSLPMAS